MAGRGKCQLTQLLHRADAMHMCACCNRCSRHRVTRPVSSPLPHALQMLPLGDAISDLYFMLQASRGSN